MLEPSAGLSNVFGPKGLFPFEDIFKCGDALTCGVSGGDDAKFTGTFEQGNTNKMASYEATYTSPVTYGPHQIKDHTYKIPLLGSWLYLACHGSKGRFYPCYGGTRDG